MNDAGERIVPLGEALVRGLLAERTEEVAMLRRTIAAIIEQTGPVTIPKGAAGRARRVAATTEADGAVTYHLLRPGEALYTPPPAPPPKPRTVLLEDAHRGPVSEALAKAGDLAAGIVRETLAPLFSNPPRRRP